MNEQSINSAADPAEELPAAPDAPAPAAVVPEPPAAPDAPAPKRGRPPGVKSKPKDEPSLVDESGKRRAIELPPVPEAPEESHTRDGRVKTLADCAKELFIEQGGTFEAWNAMPSKDREEWAGRVPR